MIYPLCVLPPPLVLRSHFDYLKNQVSREAEGKFHNQGEGDPRRLTF